MYLGLGCTTTEEYQVIGLSFGTLSDILFSTHWASHNFVVFEVGMSLTLTSEPSVLHLASY